MSELLLVKRQARSYMLRSAEFTEGLITDAIRLHGREMCASEIAKSLDRAVNSALRARLYDMARRGVLVMRPDHDVKPVCFWFSLPSAEERPQPF